MRSKFSLVILAILIGIGIYWGMSHDGRVIFNPAGDKVVVRDKPYDKYSFERLAERGGVASKIEIGRKIADYPEYASYMFYYQSEGRKISGQINLPNLSRLMAVIVMARGYVEKEDYKTGIGTKNAAAVFAKNGYITLAPDFSGYGESDPEDPPCCEAGENALGARLTKPVEILDLIASLKSLPQADLTKVYLWGHSNGGQIMLSVAEIMGMQEDLGSRIKEINIRGVTLWAPVSKPFPYNILYYTDEADDQGKWLRAQVSEFEGSYDVFKYSIDHYLDKITLPIQVHQGTMDESVPKKWSDALVKSLQDQGKTVTYYTYLGADHNMKLQPTASQSGGQAAWDKVVKRDLQFFLDLQK